MSGKPIKVQPTVEQMWKEFSQNAMRGHPQQDVPREVRASYYAGCYGMLNAVLETLRQGEPTKQELSAVWQKWANELGKFSQDYGEGKV